jgi:hypothetical protein
MELLLEEGVLRYTIPENPGHVKQRYVVMNHLQDNE